MSRPGPAAVGFRRAEQARHIWTEIGPCLRSWPSPVRARVIAPDLFALSLTMRRYLKGPRQGAVEGGDPASAQDPLVRAFKFIGDCSRGRTPSEPPLNRRDLMKVTVALRAMSEDTIRRPRASKKGVR